MKRRAAALLFVLACGGDAGPHDPPAPKLDQVCDGAGLCWSGPLPQGRALRATWGSAWNDVWAGGETLLHFDGASWSTAAAPLDEGDRVRALWGSGPRDVWAAGDKLLHFSGSAWTEVVALPNAEYISVWGAGPKDIWVLAETGDGPEARQHLLHFDGASWVSRWGPERPVLSAVWAASATQAWAVGIDPDSKGTLVLSWDGVAWAREASPGAVLLRAVWGTSGAEVWAVGGDQVLRRGAQGWSAAGTFAADADLMSLGGGPGGAVLAGGRAAVYAYDGKLWSAAWKGAATDDRHLRAIAPAGRDDAWAVGEDGLLVHAGRTFAEHSRDARTFLEGVSASSSKDAWAVGGRGTALHFDGAVWTQVTTPTTEPIYDVWTASPSSAFAVGSSGDCAGFVLRWDGSVWSMASGPTPGQCLASISGSGLANVWAAGLGGLLRWNGARWGATGPTDVGNSVFTSGPGDVWVLQDSTPGGPNAPGGVHRFDGTSWSLTQTGSAASLRKLWGSSARDLWAGGDDAAHLFHWDGAAWSALPTGLDENAGGITALWGSGPGNVWAASRLGGPLLRYNGTRWSVVAGSGNLSVAAIGGTAAGELWTVGPAGAIRHRK